MGMHGSTTTCEVAPRSTQGTLRIYRCMDLVAFISVRRGKTVHWFLHVLTVCF